MPLAPNMPGDGGGAIGFKRVTPGTYEDYNSADITGDWQVSEPSVYAAATGSPVTTISRRNGRATVRTNVDLNYSVSNFIIGSFSGTIKAGSTMTGDDSNNNGIPDRLEKAFRDNSVTVAK